MGNEFGFGLTQYHGKFDGALNLPGTGDYAIVSDYPKSENGRLSVSVWVRATSFDTYWISIISNWSAIPGGGNRGQFFLGLADKVLLAAVRRARRRRDLFSRA